MITDVFVASLLFISKPRTHISMTKIFIYLSYFHFYFLGHIKLGPKTLNYSKIYRETAISASQAPQFWHCAKYMYKTWWRRRMETFFALLALCVGNSPVTGELPAQSPVMRIFDVFLICSWINDWVNNREGGDPRRHCAHNNVIIVNFQFYPFLTLLTLQYLDHMVNFERMRKIESLPSSSFYSAIRSSHISKTFVARCQNGQVAHLRKQ